jgi:very-short-patch-repair endonuclease
LDEARKNCKYGEAMRAKVRNARLKQTFPRRLTSIERALRDAFLSRGFSFEMHRTMFERWQPDFVFEQAKLIVQADGEYWHSLPRTIEIDRRFNAAAKKAGWTVLRFEGAKIKNELAQCVDMVSRAITP